MMLPRAESSVGRAERLVAIVAVVLATGGPLLVLRDPSVGGAAGDTGNGLSVVLWALFYVAALWWARTEWPRFVRAVTADKPILTVVGLALASTMWSEFPAITLKRAIALLGTCVVAWYLAARYDEGDVLDILAGAFGTAAVLSIVFALVLPTYGVQPADITLDESVLDTDSYAGAWRGIYSTKNQLAQVMACGTVVQLLAARRLGGWRLGYVAGAAASAGLLGMTRSATGALLCVTLLGVAAGTRWLRMHSLLLASTVSAGLAVASAVGWAAYANMDALFGLLGRDPTLTGRTALWDAVVEQAAKRPWFGWGHYAFWERSFGALEVAQAVGWMPGYSHNGYLDQFLGLGIVGLAALFACLGTTLVLAARRVREGGGADAVWPLVVVVFCILANVTEGDIVQQNGYMWLMLVLVGAVVRASRWAPPPFPVPAAEPASSVRLDPRHA